MELLNQLNDPLVAITIHMYSDFNFSFIQANNAHVYNVFP
jgi:hypothetical protein